MFKVGDKVYSLIRDQVGIVVEESLQGSPQIKVCFDVKEEFDASHGWYTMDGRHAPSGGQVLFHGKPTIIPPKRKVTKFCWVYLMPGTKFDWRIAGYFANEAEARLAKKGSLFDNVQFRIIPGSEEEFEVE